MAPYRGLGLKNEDVGFEVWGLGPSDLESRIPNWYRKRFYILALSRGLGMLRVDPVAGMGTGSRAQKSPSSRQLQATLLRISGNFEYH